MSACGQCRGLGCSNAMNTENIDNDESENEEEYHDFEDGNVFERLFDF